MVYAWDVPTASAEEVQVLIEALGHHMEDVSYITTEDEPIIGNVEVEDVLPDFTITKQEV